MCLPDSKKASSRRVVTFSTSVDIFAISAEITFHKSHGKAATVTTTYPPGRFGALEIVDRQVRSFREKPKGDGAMINGGFFILSPQVIDYIEGDATTWEEDPLTNIAADGELLLDARNENGAARVTLDGAALQSYREEFPSLLDADSFQLEQ